MFSWVDIIWFFVLFSTYWSYREKNMNSFFVPLLIREQKMIGKRIWIFFCSLIKELFIFFSLIGEQKMNSYFFPYHCALSLHIDHIGKKIKYEFMEGNKKWIHIFFPIYFLFPYLCIILWLKTKLKRGKNVFILHSFFW